jgi:hypothetical protein
VHIIVSRHLHLDRPGFLLGKAALDPVYQSSEISIPRLHYELDLPSTLV